LLPRWLGRLIESIDSTNETLVFIQDRIEESYLSSAGVKAISADDIIPLNSEQDLILYAAAANLVGSVALTDSSIVSSDPTKYLGLSIWEHNRYHLQNNIWKLLKGIEALRTIVRTNQIEYVISFEREGKLWKEFGLAIDNNFDTYEIERQKVEAFSLLDSRLLLKALPGWLVLAIRDVYVGTLSYPHPRLTRLPTNNYKRPVLFVVDSYATYLESILPIIEQTAKEFGAIVLNIGKVIRQRRLALPSVDITFCSKFISPSAWASLRRSVLALKEAWSDLEINDTFKKQFVFQGLNLWPLVKSKLKQDFLTTYPGLMAWTEGVISLLEVRQPAAIVAVPDRHARARIVLSLGKSLGIPSLTIQGALLADNPRYGPMYADRAAVIDIFSKDILMKRGSVAEEQISITGTPRWDGAALGLAAANDDLRKNAVRESLGIESNQKIVVFATQRLPHKQTANMVRPLLYELSVLPAVFRMVIKLHPREDIEVSDGLLEELDWNGEVPIIVKNIDLYGLLAASELLVTGFSNVALEAALLDKPVMIINFTGEPDPLPFVEQGIAVGAYSVREVKDLCRALLEDTQIKDNLRNSRQQYLKQNPQMLDGKATERVVDMIRELAWDSELDRDLA